jgi:hypothetical protein
MDSPSHPTIPNSTNSKPLTIESLEMFQLMRNQHVQKLFNAHMDMVDQFLASCKTSRELQQRITALESELTTIKLERCDPQLVYSNITSLL